jgi:hypothetical protein
MRHVCVSEGTISGFLRLGFARATFLGRWGGNRGIRASSAYFVGPSPLVSQADDVCLLGGLSRPPWVLVPWDGVDLLEINDL